MGLFTYYLGYKAAKRRARREREDDDDFDDVICDNCGYARRQHSDDGECPSYS